MYRSSLPVYTVRKYLHAGRIREIYYLRVHPREKMRLRIRKRRRDPVPNKPTEINGNFEVMSTRRTGAVGVLPIYRKKPKKLG